MSERSAGPGYNEGNFVRRRESTNQTLPSITYTSLPLEKSINNIKLFMFLCLLCIENIYFCGFKITYIFFSNSSRLSQLSL